MNMCKSFQLLVLFMVILVGIVPADDMPKSKARKEPERAAIDEIFKVSPDPAGRQYFPKGRSSYYTRSLAAMQEPSVMAALPAGTDFVLRFTYLRSFHEPLAVRVSKIGSVVHARAVRLSMGQKHGRAKITHDKTLTLDAAAQKRIEALRNQRAFWKPLSDFENTVSMNGIDGSMWIFELHDKDGYKMIDLWCPDALAAFRDKLTPSEVAANGFRDFRQHHQAGIWMLELGKILPNGNDLY